MESTKEILRNQYRSSIKETRDTKKKSLHSSILEEKIYAFKHDIKTKNIGEIHVYHGDTSILIEANRNRKCIRHITIWNSFYLRYSYAVFIRNYL